MIIYVHQQPLQRYVLEDGAQRFGFLEGYDAGLERLVALLAVAGGAEGILAVMAGAAGLALFHVPHGEFPAHRLVGEDSGVAFGAFVVHVEMELVTESGVGNPRSSENDILRLHPLVAAAAILCDRKNSLAVMAGAAGLPFFHLGHGHRFAVGDDDLAVVAAAAFDVLGDMLFMAEYRIGDGLDLVGDGAWFPGMAADTVLFAGDVECLDTGVAGAA